MSSNTNKLAIVGGGISGLSAAYYAVKNGHPAEQIDLYEASSHQGGKLENDEIGGEVVNKGGEFIDSTNKRLIEMCEELGLVKDVDLIPCEDQKRQSFAHPDGTSIVSGDQFLEGYKAISEQIILDKQIIAADPQGARAKELDGMSAEQYLQYLGATVVPEQDNRTYSKWAWDLVTFQSNRVDPSIIAMASTAYASEAGRPASQISALQFAMEASPRTNAFLESDCGYRIKGGAERLITLLEAHLKSKNVNFHQNCKLENVSRDNGQLNLDFTSEGKTQSAKVDKVILGLATYQLGKVKGLENLGFSTDSLDTISSLQYSKNIKFTIALQPGVKLPEESFFGSGYQTWNPTPNQLTFLCTPEEAQNMNRAELIATYTQRYAKAHGMNANRMFDYAPKMSVFANPATMPCYAATAPGQMQKLIALKNSLDAAGDHGIALAGTYFPMLGVNNRQGIGFIECGLNSAMQASMRLCPPVRNYEQELLAQRQLPPIPSSRYHERS